MSDEGFIISLPVDLKDVEGWEARSGVQLPPGRYDATISRLMQKDGDAGKQLLVVYAIKGGEYDGQETMPDSLTLADKIPDPEKQKKALGKYKQFMLALSKGKVDHGQQFRSANLKGKDLSFEVFNELYEGSLRNKFRNYMAYDETNPSPGARPGSVTPTATPGAAPTGDVMDF